MPSCEGRLVITAITGVWSSTSFSIFTWLRPNLATWSAVAPKAGTILSAISLSLSDPLSVLSSLALSAVSSACSNVPLSASPIDAKFTASTSLKLVSSAVSSRSVVCCLSSVSVLSSAMSSAFAPSNSAKSAMSSVLAISSCKIWLSLAVSLAESLPLSVSSASMSVSSSSSINSIWSENEFICALLLKSSSDIAKIFSNAVTKLPTKIFSPFCCS